MAQNETVLHLSEDSVVVFDLDDTLYQELDFVHSGFRAVAESLSNLVGVDVFGELLSLYEQGVEDIFGAICARHRVASDITESLVRIYREHKPNLILPDASARILAEIARRRIPMGLLTDGRSITQRNKIRALGIEDYFAEIVISEEIGSTKPAPQNYLHFEQVFNSRTFVYIGDNPQKDFVTPNALGWQTIGLSDNGRNIHKQVMGLPSEYFPQSIVASLDEIRLD
jgi:putative hydrolase of the HAD superfamily